MASLLLYSSSKLRMTSNGNIKSQNTSGTTSTTLLTPNNFSYNFNEFGSHLEGISHINNFKKQNYKIRNKYQNAKKLKKEMLDNMHKETLREGLGKKYSDNVFLTNTHD